QHLLAGLGLEVQRDAALVAVHVQEAEAVGALHLEAHGAAGLVAGAGRLHLDHVGAKVAKQHAGVRAGHHLGDVENADACQGERAGCVGHCLWGRKKSAGNGGRSARTPALPRRGREENQIPQASVLTFASLITLAHLASSTCMNSRIFSGEPPPSSAPETSSFSMTSGIASALFTSSFMRLAIAGDILPGPTRPYQVGASTLGKPDSAIVGTLGWPEARLRRVCAIAMTLPLFTCGVAAVIVSKLYCTWPPMRSVSIGPEPLYGTWIACTPACSLNISSARCCAEPVPAEPKLTAPGCAL